MMQCSFADACGASASSSNAAHGIEFIFSKEILAVKTTAMVHRE
jgi:hypothetical protein